MVNKGKGGHIKQLHLLPPSLRLPLRHSTVPRSDWGLFFFLRDQGIRDHQGSGDRGQGWVRGQSGVSQDIQG